jgi:ribosomal protein S27E
MHNKTKFQITGAHLATPCESCHHQQNNWQFKGTQIECISCHENIHKNELKSEFLPNNDCRNCHQTENWNTINFDHNKTNFPLQGKHSSIFLPLKKGVKPAIKMFTSGSSRLMEFPIVADVMHLKIGNPKSLIISRQSLI